MVVIFPMISALAGRPVFQETPLFPTSASASSILRGPGTSDRDVGLGVTPGLSGSPGPLHLSPAPSGDYQQMRSLLRPGAISYSV